MQVNCVHIDQFVVVGFSLVFPLFLFISFSPTTATRHHHHHSSNDSRKISIDISMVQFTTELRDFDEMNGTRFSLKELKRLFRYPSAMVAFSSLFSSIYHKKVSIFCFVFSVLSIVYGVRYWSSFHCFWWCFVDGFP